MLFKLLKHSRLKVTSQKPYIPFLEIHGLELSLTLSGNCNNLILVEYASSLRISKPEAKTGLDKEESKIGSSPPPNALVCA